MAMCELYHDTNGRWKVELRHTQDLLMLIKCVHAARQPFRSLLVLVFPSWRGRKTSFRAAASLVLCSLGYIELEVSYVWPIDAEILRHFLCFALSRPKCEEQLKIYWRCCCLFSVYLSKCYRHNKWLFEKFRTKKSHLPVCTTKVHEMYVCYIGNLSGSNNSSRRQYNRLTRVYRCGLNLIVKPQYFRCGNQFFFLTLLSPGNSSIHIEWNKLKISKFQHFNVMPNWKEHISKHNGV